MPTKLNHWVVKDPVTGHIHACRTDMSWRDFSLMIPGADSPYLITNEEYLALSLDPDMDGYLHTIVYNEGSYEISEVFLSAFRMTGAKSSSKLFDDLEDDTMIVDEKPVDYVRESLNRTKKIFRRLLLHNYTENTRLVTLTFAKAVHDRDEAWHAFNIMTIRFKKVFGVPLNYIAVPELHPGGHGIHFHLVINNDWFEYSKFINDVWRMGWVKISDKFQVYDNATASNLASYLVKYIGKDMALNEIAKKRYTRGGVWKTDWRTVDAVTSDIDASLRALISYLDDKKVKYHVATFEPYEGQKIHRIVFASAQLPGLDLPALLRDVGKFRTDPESPSRGNLAPPVKGSYYNEV